MRILLPLLVALAAFGEDNINIPELPPQPPRMTIEGVSGSETASAFLDNQKQTVSFRKLPELNKAISDANPDNLMKLHGNLRRAHEFAVKKAKEAAGLVIPMERQKNETAKAQAAYDKASKSQKAAAQKKLKFEQGQDADFERMKKRRDDEAAEAMTAYTAAADAYNAALAAAKPAIESFRTTGGFKGGKGKSDDASAEKPADDKPADDKPADEKPAENKAPAKKPAAKKK